MIGTAEPGDLHNPGMDQLSQRDWNLIALLVFCTLGLYFRTAYFDSLYYDDQLYVFANTYMNQGLSLRAIHWAMSAAPNGNWHPLTTLIQLTISSLFGMKPGAYHLVNAALHAVNVSLLYIFLHRTTRLIGPAFFTALLWGLHPLRVESVVWIAELKDVLCGMFWLSCMLAYVKYARHRTAGRYALVVVMLICALLSKPMAVTLPFALLLLDYWPLSRNRTGDQNRSATSWWTWRVLEKLPLLACSLADMFPQQHNLVLNTELLPLGIRVENAVVSIGWYLRDLFFPHHLALFYPHPYMVGQPISVFSVIAIAFLIAVISVVVLLRIKTQPYLAVGWFWFLGTLVPVSGLIQAGEQARADRFTYLPSIGLVWAIVYLVWHIASNRRSHLMLAASAGAVVAIALAIVSSMDITPWRNTTTAFDHLYELQPDNYLAISMQAAQVFDGGDQKRGLAMEADAVQHAPRSVNCLNTYGQMLLKMNRLNEAHDAFYRALKANERTSENWDGLGMVYAEQATQLALRKDPTEQKFRKLAISAFEHAIEFDPIALLPRNHLAFQLAVMNRTDEAIKTWQDELEIQPNDAHAHGDLADALRLKGDLAGAVQHYRIAINLGAKNPAWETDLAWLVATSPQATPADVQPMIAIAKDACDQTSNRDAAALDAYAACLARVGRFDNAITTAQQAVAQANAANQPDIAAAISRRLARYQKYETFVAGDDATTQPGTAPTTQIGPT